MPLSPVPCLLRCATSIFRCADTSVCQARTARTRRCPASRRACPARAATAKTAPSRERACAVYGPASEREGTDETRLRPLYTTTTSSQMYHRSTATTTVQTHIQAPSTASTAVCNSKELDRHPCPCSHMAASHEQPNVSTFLPQRAHWPPRRRRLSVGWATLGVFFCSRTKKRRKIQADASPASSPK